MNNKNKKSNAPENRGLPYYPYKFAPPELEGTRYLDLSPEFLGEDEMFADIPTHQEADDGEEYRYEY